MWRRVCIFWARSVWGTSVQREEELSTKPVWDQSRFVWGALLVLWAIGLWRRATGDLTPGDFTAYLSAADMFVAGLDPYTDVRFSQPRYDGFPYNYFPGTLWLIAPLAYLSTAVATSLDWVFRAVLLGTVAWVLRRRVVPEMPLHHVALVMALHEPLLIDGLVGNLVTYLLGAWAVCLEVSYRRPTWWTGVVAFLAGVVLTFKPFWLIPAGWIFVSRRQWGRTVAVSLGALSSLIVTLGMPSYWSTFASHTAEMRDFYFSVDLLGLYPPLFFVALGVGVALALYLWWRYPSRWLYLLGCVSVPVWPRIATYEYMVTLPVTFFLIRRWGWLRGAGFSAVTVGPLPWLLRDAGVLPGEQLENWVMFVWVVVAAGVMVRVLVEESRKGDSAWTNPN